MCLKSVSRAEKGYHLSASWRYVNRKASTCLWRDKKTKARARVARLDSPQFSTFIDFRFCGRGLHSWTRNATRPRRRAGDAWNLPLYRVRRRRCWLSLFPGDTTLGEFSKSFRARVHACARFPEGVIYLGTCLRNTKSRLVELDTIRD